MLADDRAILRFPEDFLWGTATSSHQVEGHNTNNDWWAWEQLPGKISDGSTSGPAADWWQRAEEDFDRAAALSQNTLRLSLEWSRCEPQEGEWDEAALARYRQMLQGLRDRGIRPMVTLHHFTNPLWLAAKGGWENPEVVPLFDRYTSKVVEELGDLCTLWCTLNEPLIYIVFGYIYGTWPPGVRSLPRGTKVFRNMVRAHGRAYHTIHRLQADAQVSIAKHLRIFDPANTESQADRWAARLLEHVFNDAFLHAVTKGRIKPPFGLWELIPQAIDSLDYIGVNYYSRDMVAFDITQPASFFARRFANPNSEFSMEGWGEVYPEGLYRILVELRGYGKPLYITEVGIPDNTDEQRPRFILTHAAATHRAVREGAPVKGLYFWSLVDNFEWAKGYSARFGLIEVEPETQTRKLKESARLYAEISKANAITPQIVEKWAPEIIDQILK
ncbi:MAG: glycoside hydrolase family 1 protein [Chloroflexota bacterium]